MLESVMSERILASELEHMALDAFNGLDHS